MDVGGALNKLLGTLIELLVSQSSSAVVRRKHTKTHI